MFTDDIDIQSITKVEGITQTKGPAMSNELKNKIANFTPLQKRYAEYRSKGLRQADAASKAGSNAQGRAALGRTGYNWEQIDGMKEYIAFLYEKRSQAAILDEIEIVEGLRKNLDLAVEMGRIDWANKTLELMGLMIGAYKAKQESSNGRTKEVQTKSSVDAFKPEGEELTQEQRMNDINKLLNSIKRSSVSKEE